MAVASLGSSGSILYKTKSMDVNRQSLGSELVEVSRTSLT